MERLKRLKRVIVMLIVIFVIDVILLTLMMPSISFFTVSVLVMQLVVVLYFAAISLGLVKEVGEHEKSQPENDRGRKSE